MINKHKHEWTVLWSHFGWYGDQDSHYHVCFDSRCKALLIGLGRSCSKDCKHEIKE